MYTFIQPFENLIKQNQGKSMADSFFGEPFRRFFFAQYSAPLDWFETPSSHVIRVNVPGLGRDEIKIELNEGNVLHVRGEAKGDREKDAVWHVMERGKGEFERRLRLPDDVRVDQIKAGVENGVLSIVVPKEPVPEKPKPRRIPVNSKL